MVIGHGTCHEDRKLDGDEEDEKEYLFIAACVQRPAY